jgi:hypothetical protein
MGDRRDAYWVLVGDLRERGHLEDLGIDGRIILKLIFTKCDGEAWTGLLWFRIGTDGSRL